MKCVPIMKKIEKMEVYLLSQAKSHNFFIEKKKREATSSSSQSWRSKIENKDLERGHWTKYLAERGLICPGWGYQYVIQLSNFFCFFPQKLADSILYFRKNFILFREKKL